MAKLLIYNGFNVRSFMLETINFLIVFFLHKNA